MTTATRQRIPARARWQRLLLAAIAAALATLLGAGTASAATLPNLETRVGASTAAAQVAVGVHESVSPGQQRVHAPPDAQIVVATGVATNTGDDLTRVGRWMSDEELVKMQKTGLVQEGGGGRTFVTNPADPAAFPAGKGVFAEFDVPTNSLFPAGKPEWSVIPGPNVGTTRFGPPPSQMPPATCIAVVCRR